jgi:hypothetical protein
VRWAGHVAYTGDRRCAYRVLFVRHIGKKPHRKPRFTWQDNFKNGSSISDMERHELGILAKDTDRWRALMNVAINFPVP